MRDEEFVPQPTVPRVALQEPPVNDEVPVRAHDGCGDREDPGRHLPAHPFVNGVCRPDADRHDGDEVLDAVVALHRVLLLEEAAQALEEAGQVRDDGNEEEESLVHAVVLARGFSVFVVSPTVVADIEIHTSQCLNLNHNF